ncbi:hypothetical protein AHAS_Ahas01G0042100 [Arachis hypogaea]
MVKPILNFTVDAGLGEDSCQLLTRKTCRHIPRIHSEEKYSVFRIHRLSSHFFADLLDSIIVDVASECHRVARLGLDSNLEEEDEELKLSAQARVRVADPSNSNEANGKYVVDIFGQSHPSVASEIFECMNCGRSIMAGRFAPHLEKCMGKTVQHLLYLLQNEMKDNIRLVVSEKYIGLSLFVSISYHEKCFFSAPPQGRKARLKVTRSSTAAAAQNNRYSRGGPVSTYSPYSNHSSNNSMNRLPNGTSNFAGEEHSNGTFEP